MKRLIEQTEDGSATLYVPQLDEHYHSVKGARTESQHIFIEMGLRALTTPAPRVLEVGFGTGLNALLTLEEAERSQRHIHYIGLELYPLQWEEIEPLHYSDNPLLRILHEVAWGEEVEITPYFTLHKVQADVTRLQVLPCSCDIFQPSSINLVYFDAFAPDKQPEMWSEEVLYSLYRLLQPEGILTTYCAKGVVRRLLQSIGFTVERLPGPPGGKREILRGRKLLSPNV